ncbi:MAG: winged helix-turn-helix transcriptional regulator [Parvularculaceae bacterium]|nr:winged helix-turn-helix transcriptional regulator [Parvularculaceae bacterium]
MSTVFKALADPTRRKVLELLREKPMTAGELAEHVVITKATLSSHFAVLKAASLVSTVKEGTTITYHLRLSVLEEAMLDFTRLFGWTLSSSETSEVTE